MRIALISYEFPPHTLGGIGTYARHTVEMLLSRGHDVMVFCGAKTSPTSPETSGARVHRLLCDDRTRFASVAVPALAAEHTRAPFEVAEAPDLFAESLGLRERLPSLPIVLRAHTPYYIPAEVDFTAISATVRRLHAARRLLGGFVRHQPWRQTWTEARRRADFRALYQRELDPDFRAARTADLIVPPSQRLAARLRADWSLPADRVRVLPYVHQPSPALLRLSPPSVARTIGFHGGIRLFKGVHLLIAAMRHVLARHPDVRLVLAGNSGQSPVARCSLVAWWRDTMVEWRDTLEWLRPQLAPLGDRVVFSGFVAPENLPAHLAAADLCVFPSLFDNFPNACLEAMSAARPIVATRSGGMEEMLADGQAGLLVPPNDPHALAAALCRLLEDAPLRHELAHAARARLLAEYNADRIGPAHEEIYRAAIELRRAAPASLSPSRLAR